MSAERGSHIESQKDYFRENGERTSLKKGEVLMKQGGFNDKLFLVIKGLLVAYNEAEEGEGPGTELFRAGKDQFVGVYSFFSRTYKSHTTIIADEDSELAYIEAESIEALENTDEVITNFLPVILDDMNRRQETVWLMSNEREQALKRLLQADKMRTLGQLSAGLAHELNNAVGVLRSKAEWLAAEISSYIKEHTDESLYPFFVKGLDEGQFLSSREVRERRKEIEKEFGLDTQKAKEIARTGFSIDELKQMGGDNLGEIVEDLDYYWDLGNAFHDIKLAADHATYVVQSVKELGAGSGERRSGLPLKKTLDEAMTLIQSLLRKVELKTEISDDIYVTASSGELVQVWINIIKNACESMINAGVPEPKLTITARGYVKKAVVHIIDNGPGIPPEIQEKIFAPDFTTKKGGLSFGLGLGLPISTRIIESYQGTVRVASEPGKTDFRVSLPLDKKTEANG